MSVPNYLRGWNQKLSDPRSPLGGGGLGRFRIAGPTGGNLDRLLCLMNLHPAAPAAVSTSVFIANRIWEVIHLQDRSSSLAPKATSKLTEADFEDAAKVLGSGIEVAIIKAFAEVESGGKSGMNSDGLPIIAFEGHIFRKYSGKKFDKTHPFLSYKYVKKAGPEWKKNNKNQKTAWNILNTALQLDHKAALQACSWGMFQVMGFNYKSLGYKSIDDFVTAMKAGERGQLAAFVGFCKSNPSIVKAMQSKDFKMMAQLYNGADFGDYAQRIEKSYKKHAKK